jgi:hypothetical protein
MVVHEKIQVTGVLVAELFRFFSPWLVSSESVITCSDAVDIFDCVGGVVWAGHARLAAQAGRGTGIH